MNDIESTKILKRCQLFETPSERWKLPGPSSSRSWQPEYRLFAAAQYFQFAYDLKIPAKHGALTLATLELLRKQPERAFMNADILREVRAEIHHAFGIPAAQQQPVFYGPAGAFDEPFVLTAQKTTAITPPPASVSEPDSVVRLLAGLEHPNPPFTVDLWLDEPGKTQFTTRDRVTLYYRVNGLQQGQKAYLTLLNVAPDGTVAILYPQKQDFAPGVGAKLYLNAEVETGKLYTIPRGQAALQPGQNVAVDLRLRLAEGKEYFKALVSSEPIDWEQMGIGEFQTIFQGAAARGLAGIVSDLVTAGMEWSTGALQVEVRE